MTTGDRLRSYMDSRQFDTGELRSFIVRYWPAILIVALAALAAGLRLWDLGGRRSSDSRRCVRVSGDRDVQPDKRF